MSHPSWVCGLKLMANRFVIVLVLSHPSWVCGLKLSMMLLLRLLLSHTLRGCVD